MPLVKRAISNQITCHVSDLRPGMDHKVLPTIFSIKCLFQIVSHPNLVKAVQLEELEKLANN